MVTYSAINKYADVYRTAMRHKEKDTGTKLINRDDFKGGKTPLCDLKPKLLTIVDTSKTRLSAEFKEI